MGLSPYFGRFWGIYDWVNFLLFFISYGFRYRALALAVAVKFPPDQGVFVNYESPAFAITQWKNIMVRKKIPARLRPFIMHAYRDFICRDNGICSASCAHGSVRSRRSWLIVHETCDFFRAVPSLVLLPYTLNDKAMD